MNVFYFIVAIVAITTFGKILSEYLKRRGDHDPKLELENRELRKELEAMRDRLHTLERITVEKENSLAREIDDLRNS